METLGRFCALGKRKDDTIKKILSWLSIVDIRKIFLLNMYFCKQAIRSSALVIRLLGKFSELDKDTDVLIKLILSWASIVDLHNVLPINSYFSDQAKQCEQWKMLQVMLPVPNLYYEGFNSIRNYRFHHEDCECDYCERFRKCSNFEKKIAYAECSIIIPEVKDNVKSLLSYYDIEIQPRGFDHNWHVVESHSSDRAKSIESAIKIQTHYSKRWILLHNIISLTMVAQERGYEPVEPEGLNQMCIYFHSVLCDIRMNTSGSSIRDWYYSYLLNTRGDHSVGSDEHLRLIVGETQKKWVHMVAILGNKALANAFDILSIVRENLEELLLTHPGPSNTW